MFRVQDREDKENVRMMWASREEEEEESGGEDERLFVFTPKTTTFLTSATTRGGRRREEEEKKDSRSSRSRRAEATRNLRKKMKDKKKKKRAKAKPGWDSSVSDMTRYKLTKEQEMRKKQNYHLLGTQLKRNTKNKKKKKKKSARRMLPEESRREKEHRRDVTSLDLLEKEEEESEELPFVTSLRASPRPEVDFEKEIEDFLRSKKKEKKKKKKVGYTSRRVREKRAEADTEEDAAKRGNVREEDTTSSSTDSKLFQEMAELLGEDEEEEEAIYDTHAENDRSGLRDCDVSSIDDTSSVTSSVRLLREVDDIINEEKKEEEEARSAENDRVAKAAAAPARDETVLNHLVSKLETRLASLSPPPRPSSVGDPLPDSDAETSDPVPRLLRVCDGLVQNLAKTTLMQKHHQEILLKVQLEADRWKREYEGLARDVDSMHDSMDNRILHLEERAVGDLEENDHDGAFVDVSACSPVEMNPSVVVEEDIESVVTPVVVVDHSAPKPRTIRLIPRPTASPASSSASFPVRSAERGRVSFRSPVDLSLRRAAGTNISARKINDGKGGGVVLVRGGGARRGPLLSRGKSATTRDEDLHSSDTEKEKSRRAHRAIFFDAPASKIKKKAGVLDVETRIVAAKKSGHPLRKPATVASPSSFKPVLLL